MIDINLMGFFFVSLNIFFFADFLLADVALMRVFGRAFGCVLDFFCVGDNNGSADFFFLNFIKGLGMN